MKAIPVTLSWLQSPLLAGLSRDEPALWQPESVVAGAPSVVGVTSSGVWCSRVDPARTGHHPVEWVSSWEN